MNDILTAYRAAAAERNPLTSPLINNAYTRRFVYNTAKFAAKKGMAYLRGSKYAGPRKPYRGAYRGHTQMQIDSLARAIERGKPAKSHLFYSGTHTNLSKVDYFTQNPTQGVCLDVDYRKYITGDKWKFHSLRLNFKLSSLLRCFRLIVYTPKKIGQNHSITKDDEGLVGHVDRNKFNVIREYMVPIPDPGNNSLISFLIPINRVVTYETSTSTLVGGEVKWAAIYEATGSSGTMTTWEEEITISDV